jgi:hypothetical protein
LDLELGRAMLKREPVAALTGRAEAIKALGATSL